MPPDTLNILGTNIHCLPSYEACYQQLLQVVRQGNGSAYITLNNSHTLVEAVRDANYRHILNHSLLALADGRPISMLGRIRGLKHMQRIFGPTFLEKVIEWGQKDGLRHYFFGNKPETLAKMCSVIAERYPQAQIVGMLAPPFRPFTVEENRTFIEQIAAANPDIIWVSLGAPKQERWIYEHYRYLQHGVFIGVGAGFSYLAGTLKHAPQWMKSLALEWLFRLMQEPSRLFRRYLVCNSLFLYYVAKEFFFANSKGSGHNRPKGYG